MEDPCGVLALIDVRFDDPEKPISENYLLPLISASGEQARQLEATARAGGGQGIILEGAVFDGLLSNDFCLSLLGVILNDRDISCENGGVLAGCLTGFFRKMKASYLAGLASGQFTPHVMTGEQSNTSIRYGNEFVLKLIRKLEKGGSLDIEVTRFLTDSAAFTHSAPLVGSLEYMYGRQTIFAVASLGCFVQNEGDAWTAIFRKDGSGDYEINLPKASLLGQRTLEMHRCLASGTGEFAPEELGLAEQQAAADRMKLHGMHVFNDIRQSRASFPEALKSDVMFLLQNEEELLRRFAELKIRPLGAAVIRTHSDYHMGQVLNTGDDFVILDFEGEPARPLDERRRKQCALRDVAGIIRSIHYAAASSIFDQDKNTETESREACIASVSKAFLEGYFGSTTPQDLHGPRAFLPSDPAATRLLLDVFVLEKALYEMGYEMNNRPDWVRIPLEGLVRLCKSGGAEA